MEAIGRLRDPNFSAYGNDSPQQTTVRTPGQRDPERTRRAILDAATEEFVAKGFAGASVNEIAERANVNKRMLYHYFGKKDKLYIAVLERVYTSLRTEQVQQLKLSDLPPAEAIRKLILFTWEYYLSHPEFLSLMMTENMLKGKYALRSEHIRGANAPFLNLMKSILERGQREGVFKHNVDPFHLYLTIASLGSFHVATRFTLSSLLGYDLTPQSELDARVQHITDVILGYLRP